MHFQPHDRHGSLTAPVFCRLPAEIPYTHAFFAVAANAMLVFRSLGAITVNLPIIEEYAGGRAEMLFPARPARADGYHAKRYKPVRGRVRQYDPHQLNGGRAVHNQDDFLILRPFGGMIEYICRQRHGALGLAWAGMGRLRAQFLLYVML